MDPQRLPTGVIDGKLAQQYQVVALARRGSRLFIGGADPTDLEVIERIWIRDPAAARVGDRRARQAGQDAGQCRGQRD